MFILSAGYGSLPFPARALQEEAEFICVFDYRECPKFGQIWGTLKFQSCTFLSYYIVNKLLIFTIYNSM
jgi:hypothetical protein